MPMGKGTYGSKVGRPSKAAKAKKKIARVAPPRNKITEADFKVLRRSNAQENTKRRKKA